MKKAYIALLSLALPVSGLVSCSEMMTEAGDAEIVEPITVSYKVNAVTGFVDADGKGEPDPNFPTEGLKATFVNYEESSFTSATVDADGIATATLTPGVYTINVAGSVENEGETYYLNGAAQNISLTKNVSREEAAAGSTLNLRPAKVGPLCIKEVYYCGISPYYFRDQTYEIYNNGDEVYYLDHLCFTQLYPDQATAVLPAWPASEGKDNFVYGITLWQFPGNGTDYPLAPGESVIIVQESRDHRENNPDSFDNSMAEWEMWAGGKPERDNPNVPNLQYVFWGGYINTWQWLTSVSGAAFCLYQPGQALTFGDTDYWKLGETTQKEVNGTYEWAKIPAEAVMDGVEFLPSMSDLNMKRIPGFVDAGGFSVGEIYVGKSVSRKKIGERPDGTPLYQDTNNSTDDFQINDRPAIRRNGEKVPSWSPSNH